MKFGSFALTVGLSIIAGLSFSNSSPADVITPELEAQNIQLSKLENAVESAKRSGNFDQQMASAKALERFCLRSYYPYGVQNLNARLAMAEVLWAHKQPAEGERLLKEFYTTFDRKYTTGIRKMALAEKRSSPIYFQNDPEADSYTFYKAGPGTVSFENRVRLLVTLADLCTVQGKSQEAASYMARASQIFKTDGKNSGQSWTGMLEWIRASHRISSR